jgi:hypothetical protein
MNNLWTLKSSQPEPPGADPISESMTLGNRDPKRAGRRCPTASHCATAEHDQPTADHPEEMIGPGPSMPSCSAARTASLRDETPSFLKIDAVSDLIVFRDT